MISLRKTVFLNWGTVGKSYSGKTLGVRRQPLCEAFLDLYSIADSKEAKVVEIWMREDGGAWDPKFLRSFNDWELDAIQEFIEVTSNIRISPLEKDNLVWKGDVSGSFTVKPYFNLLEGASPRKVPCKMLWNKHIPSKVGFFAWEVWWAKVLTSTQLKKRDFQLASMCPFCRKEEEELEHILIRCQAIGGHWTDLLSALGGLDLPFSG